MTNSAGRTTLISPGTTVRGDITFTGHLDIEGEVNGSIQAEAGQDAILRIVEGGKVAGEVKVPHAMINGKVEGDIHATERLELAERDRPHRDTSGGVDPWPGRRSVSL